jgi:UDP-2,3-diacylglucosamine pyrophosphatase LpxH
MIGILGDIHGDFFVLGEKVRQAKAKGATAVIQVGDFGYYPRLIAQLRQLELALPVYWIDGNHETHEHFLDEDNRKTHENCLFVPRGTVVEIDGRRIAFMGGASSVDKETRLAYGMHWSPLENIRPQDMTRMREELAKVNNKVDMFITHVPTQSVIQKNFDPRVLRDFFGLPLTWRDPNADLVEELWNEMGNVPMYCGHMHRSLKDGNCRILNIDEMIYV